MAAEVLRTSDAAGPYAGGGNGGVAESAGNTGHPGNDGSAGWPTLEAEEVPMETRIQDSMVVPVSSSSHTLPK